MSDDHYALAQKIAGKFMELHQVVAVALGGSSANSMKIFSDSESDIDVYVFIRELIPLDVRIGIVEATGGALKKNMGLEYWGPGDEWINAETNIEVDIVYFDKKWIEGEIEKVIDRKESGIGYTTCFWKTLENMLILADSGTWLSNIKRKCQVEYPEELASRIVEKNYPLLAEIIPSFGNQIKKAVKRNDIVSINHRVAAFLASYFDIVLAVNRRLHPGEKRLLEYIEKNCPSVPVDMRSNIMGILVFSLPEIPSIPSRIDELVGNLKNWLEHEGFSV